MNVLLSPKKLRLETKPSKLDILRAFIYEKEKWLLKHKSKKDPGNSLLADILTEKIQKIYLAAGTKPLRKDKIKQKVQQIYNSRMDLLKTQRTKRFSEIYTKRKDEYLANMAIPVDFADKNQCKSRNSDVREKQKLDYSNVELVSSAKRDAAILSRQKSYAIVTNYENESEAGTTCSDNDPDFSLPVARTTNEKRDLSKIIEVKSRYTFSERGAAALVNATLKTFDIPTIIDKSKLVRAQKRKFADVDNFPVVFGGGLYYDSRKDLTLIQKKKKDETGRFKYYRSMCREDHYSFVSEPSGVFLGFIPMQPGDAKQCSRNVISFLKEKNFFADLMALGSDGTNLNVGAIGGINHFIETELKRPLHWFVCLLHANELPMKKLIVKLDGPTTGKNSFEGPIGKSLANVDNIPIVSFKKIASAEPLPQLPDDVYKKLSNDQKYLYKIVNALITGNFPKSLSQLKIGELNHSRWITTASRVCKFYAATKHPSKNLIIITSYIVQVYAPTWFQIKKNELAINGPENLFFLMQKSNLVADEKAKFIVQECIQRNAFFAHSENVLLAQLSSERMSYRVDAVNKILQIRELVPDTEVRLFKVPELNFKAKLWTGMAEMTDSNVTEPPFTLNMNEDELLEIIRAPLIVPKFRCHTQMVERAVKEVTRVSKTVLSHEKRNSTIKLTLISRANYPKLESKKDFLTDEPVCCLPKI